MPGLDTVLPWSNIAPDVLEELLYALVRHMGAIEYEWRSSPGAINTPDGGRDIEAIFERIAPSGEVESERWWLDAKQRSKPVSPTDVKEVALNSAGRDDVDVMIIATNSSFSNPTRDWVKVHNARQIGPSVELWDRRRLQELVKRYPAAAAETMVAALDFQTRIDFLAAYFYESGRILTEAELEVCSDRRIEISNSAFLLAACYADGAADNYARRPWATSFSSAIATEVTILAHSSLVVALLKHDTISDEYAIKASAYVTEFALTILDPASVERILSDPFHYLKGRLKSPPPHHFTHVVLQYMLQELVDICSSDCARVMLSDPSIHTRLEPEDFWLRFDPNFSPKPESGGFVISSSSVPCAVGFELDKDTICPLLRDEIADMREVLEVASRVIRFRCANPTGQYSKYKENLTNSLGGASVIADCAAQLFPQREANDS